jgi:hypothetical protein
VCKLMASQPVEEDEDRRRSRSDGRERDVRESRGDGRSGHSVFEFGDEVHETRTIIRIAGRGWHGTTLQRIEDLPILFR